MRRTLTFAVVILGVLGLFSVSATDATAFDWGVNEFNMNATPESAAYAVLTIGAMTDPPWFLGFSEVCNAYGFRPDDLDDMADWIEYHLGPIGYSNGSQNFLSMTNYSSACIDKFGNQGKFGIMSYTRGPGVPSTSVYFTSPAGGYNEGAICAQSNTYLGSIVSCSTHLYNQAGAVGQQQATELRVYASSIYPGVKKVLIGDFNLRPRRLGSCRRLPDGGTLIPVGYYENYYEADQCSNRATRGTGIKNDFMFGAKNAFLSWGFVSTASVVPY